MAHGNVAEARRRLLASLEARETREAHAQLGILLERVGEPREAAEHFRRALDLTEQRGDEGAASRAQLLEHLGDAFRRAGEERQAERMYRQALSMWDEVVRRAQRERAAIVHVRRGVLLSRLGNARGAEEAFGAAMDAAPSWRETYALILSHLVVSAPNLQLAQLVLRRAQFQLTLEPEWEGLLRAVGAGDRGARRRRARARRGARARGGGGRLLERAPRGLRARPARLRRPEQRGAHARTARGGGLLPGRAPARRGRPPGRAAALRGGAREPHGGVLRVRHGAGAPRRAHQHARGRRRRAHDPERRARAVARFPRARRAHPALVDGATTGADSRPHEPRRHLRSVRREHSPPGRSHATELHVRLLPRGARDGGVRGTGRGLGGRAARVRRHGARERCGPPESAPQFQGGSSSTCAASCRRCGAPIEVPLDVSVRELSCAGCGQRQRVNDYVSDEERFALDMQRQVAGNEAFARLKAEGCPAARAARRAPCRTTAPSSSCARTAARPSSSRTTSTRPPWRARGSSTASSPCARRRCASRPSAPGA
ncbi:MAG: tetratricopeptide repeat protein [Sandaracinaceae bacterium]|nr:tetratricopeptide repeat protein [Sandaracinaceae bacterium]